MFNSAIDITQRKLLSLLQTEFPLALEPFTELGLKLGLSAGEVLRRVQNFKDTGIIRQISPIMDARKLGYQSTLVAMKVPADCLEKAARVIHEHLGISHGYERNHEFNVWVTLAVPGKTNLETALKQLAVDAGAKTICDLPALKVFKLRAIFGEDAESTPVPETNIPPILKLTTEEKNVINVIQQDITIDANPFTLLAQQSGMSTEDFLNLSRSLKQRGIIRRYGAAINHRNAGFQTNAMVGWVTDPKTADINGQVMAVRREISHCYVRKTNPHWRYNLFTMIHSPNKEGCQLVVRELVKETGLTDYVMLYSTRELKKTRIKYPV